MFLKDVSYG